jgi:hypothetical protein
MNAADDLAGVVRAYLENLDNSDVDPDDLADALEAYEKANDEMPLSLCFLCAENLGTCMTEVKFDDFDILMSLCAVCVIKLQEASLDPSTLMAYKTTIEARINRHQESKRTDKMSAEKRSLSVKFYAPNQVWMLSLTGNENRAQCVYLYPNGDFVMGTDYSTAVSAIAKPIILPFF